MKHKKRKIYEITNKGKEKQRERPNHDGAE
jgi:DNA-binding PadR family transcriptional regulator